MSRLVDFLLHPSELFYYILVITPMVLSGYIAILSAMIVSRIVNERGYRVLSDEQKIRLMDGFSRTRAYSLIPLFILIGVYYMVMTMTDLDKGMITIGYFSLLAAFIVISYTMNYKKMKMLDMPDSYMRFYGISQVVSFLGAAWFFYAIIGTKLARA